MTEFLYRYEDWLFGLRLQIRLLEFPIVKRTACGAWIYEGFAPSDPTEFFERLVKEKRLRKECRFVLFASYKKYACLTREEAMKSFRARKRAQIRILEGQLQRAKDALLASGDQTATAAVKPPRLSLFD